MTKVQLVGLAATGISLAVFLLQGVLSPDAKAKNESDFFSAGGRTSTDDYANSFVGYALQMAAFFLFATWGYQYGLGALWAVMFWFVGWIVLRSLTQQFADFRENTADSTTMHEYIKLRFGSTRTLQLVAALATVLGLAGTMFAEVDYVAQVLAPVIGSWHVGAQLLLWIALCLVGSWYVIWNGFLAEVRVARTQMLFAYAGIGMAISVLCFALARAVPSRSTTAICGIVALSFFAAGLARSGFPKDRSWRQKAVQLQGGLISLVFAFVCLVLAGISFYHGGQVHNADAVFSLPYSVQLEAQGWLGVVSLFFANALWMLVDASTWQRVGSMPRTETLANNLELATSRIAIESPATWILGCAFGWLIHDLKLVPTGGSEWNAMQYFAEALANGGIFGAGATALFLYGLFIAACIAVMLSTVASLLSTVGFTVERDLLREEDSLKRAKTVTALSLLVLGAGYLVLKVVLGASTSGLLYTAYSSQLALWLVVLLALFRERRGESRAATSSILSGLAAAALMIILQILNPSLQELAVLPPLIVALASLGTYVLVNLLSKQSDSGASAAR